MKGLNEINLTAGKCDIFSKLGIIMVTIGLLSCHCCIDGSYTAIPQVLFCPCFICFSGKKIASFEKCLITFPFFFCFVSSHTHRSGHSFPTLTEIHAAWGKLEDLGSSCCMTLYKVLSPLVLRFLYVKQGHPWDLFLSDIHWLSNSVFVLVLVFHCYFLFFFNWRIIALQYFVGRCHPSTWINHRYIYVPFLLHPPLISHPLGGHRTLSWDSVLISLWES